jgi:hypothetical protein
MAIVDDLGMFLDDPNEVLPLPAPPPTMLYVPEFLDGLIEFAEDNMTYETVHRQLLAKDWITPGLSTEINSCFPKAAQIDKAAGSRDLEAFKTNCSQLFHVGRIFASHKQVEQTAKLFLDAWAISSSCIGKKVVCYYSKPPKRSTSSSSSPSSSPDSTNKNPLI